ncbi:MAG: ATP-binding cassette domain-containing protein [Deltaproteobacteria bacterium]|nr:ATP-binding cassette domain-containing protein [Deltaproteobacteria bacterium]
MMPNNYRNLFFKAKGHAWIPLLLAGFLLPLAAESYVLRAVSVFYIHVLLGAGLSLIVNYAGLLNLGYAAFFAIGAYSYALMNTYAGISFFAVLPLGLVIAALFGLLLGFPTLRVRGDYLALVTLAFGEIIRILLLNIWGPSGISGIQPPMSASAVGGVDNLYLLFYFVTFLPLPVTFFILSRIDTSKLARTWRAIRDNETAANFCGMNSMRWLLLALVIGSAFAGVAGVIFAGIQRFVSPVSFSLEESIFFLSIVVIAGGQSRWRLLIAAAVLSLLPELMRNLADYRLLIYGMLLSVFVVAEEQIKAKLISRHRAANNNALRVTEFARSSGGIPPFLLKDTSTHEWELKVANLTMQFGGLTAIDRVDFSIPLAGRSVGLIGPNGAGKTTLFNCICGHCRPTAGSISFPGIGADRTPDRVARAGLARTFQTPQLFHSMTVRENIAAAVMGSPRSAEAAVMVKHIIDYLGLGSIADTNTALLPFGFQRLTELGRALALGPRVILIDELASGLNSHEKQQMAALIRELSARAGIGFLVVEHDMDFVLPLASEILVLDSGKLIARGHPSDIRKDAAVIDAYLGSSYALA